MTIGYARLTDARYFCWAPFDSQNEYTIKVVIKDRGLSDQEIRKRYHIWAKGLDSRSIKHVKNIIKQYETTYGRRDKAKVTLAYSTNGFKKPDWVWPPR